MSDLRNKKAGEADRLDVGLQVRLVRVVSFAAAHRYASPLLNASENQKIYGSLYREDGFGHNFLVEAHFGGEIEQLTGMIINLVDVDSWLKSVAARFDHKHLNTIPEFSGLTPTLERLAEKFSELLQGFVRDHQRVLAASGDNRQISLVKIRVYEGETTWLDYWS